MGKENRVRCLNCFERIIVPPGTEKLTCKKCGVEYVIYWREGHAKIAGTPGKSA